MGSIGSLKLSWNKGYAGSHVQFISSDVICYKIGNNIKFVGEDGSETIYTVPGDTGVGSLAVHSINGVFAFSEKTVQPKIFVLQYPSLLTVSEISDGAQLEYTSLSFSTSEYLASISGIPDYQLIIWRYTDGTKLISHDVSHEIPTWITFNPGNWRQLSLSTPKELTVWTIEQNNEVYKMSKRRCNMLRSLVSDGENDAAAGNTGDAAADKELKTVLKMPLSSIAGLQGADSEKFLEYQTENDRMVAVSHCWTPTGDILVGCIDGELLRVDAETGRVTLMTCHQHIDTLPVTEDHSSGAKQEEQSASENEEGRQTDEHIAPERLTYTAIKRGSRCTDRCGPIPKPPSGLFTSLALHKRALFAGGTDGTLCELSLSGNHALVVSTCDIQAPITSLSFSPSHHKLAIGSTKGSVHLYHPDDKTDNNGQHGKLQVLINVHFGNFIAVCSLSSSSEYCVTLRESGQLQVWNASHGELVSSLSIGSESSALGTSPLLNVAAVGTHSGHVHFVDLQVGKQPRILHVVRLHKRLVRQISFNANGEFVVTTSFDGNIFVLDGRPSKNFAVLGFITVPGFAIGLSTYLSLEDGSTYVAVAYSKNNQHSATAVIYFCLTFDLARNATTRYKNAMCEFQSEATRKMLLGFEQPVCAIVLTDARQLHVISQKDNSILKYRLPEEVPKQELNKEYMLAPADSYPGHLLPGGRLLLSPHRKWLASGGGDGRVCVRRLDNLGHVDASIVAHSFWKGGILDVAFLPDGQRLLTTGFDGTLCCFQWRTTPGHDAESQDAMRAAQALTKLLGPGQVSEENSLATMPTWTEPVVQQILPAEGELHDDDASRIEKEIEEAIANDRIYMSEIPKPQTFATWLEFKQYEVMTDEDKAFATAKKELREEIRTMRRKLQKMMADNEGMTAIEKLPRYEFDLDIEEQKRLQAQCEVEVQKLREEKEFENLGKMYLTDVIRKECWDDMSVKGRGIVAFNTSLEVYNFPLKDRPREELEELEVLKSRRRIELAELAARQQIVDSVLETHSNSNDQTGIKSASSHPESTRRSAMKKMNSTIKSEDEKGEKEGVDTDSSSLDLLREKSTIMGSQAEELGTDTSLFYPQFELCTREQKITEIKLIQDSIHRIKVQYNKDFDDVLTKKELEISKIREKNKRIRKIMDDLNIPDPVYQPELGPIEKPEMLLVTNDSEVDVEKFLTPEQQKKLEEERKADEERRLREKIDNWRERGLDQMMGGVLEIKKEDELKKDIPIPVFMQEKKTDDWTEEEKKTAADYERKVKELEEEREKFRKQLELELKKLQTAVQEGTQAFDDTHNQLFMKRVKTELVISQLELKIQRLRFSLLQEEEMANRELELNISLDQKRRLAQTNSMELNLAKKQLEEFRNEYENLGAEDRAIDKGFRREFADLSVQQADQLYKHFRKRPRGQKARMMESQAYDASSSNPFSDRPSSARQREESQRALDIAMQELDKAIPENMEPTIWDRLCKYRREKVECEHLIKQKALVLADMQAFVQRRHEEDDQVKNEIEELEEELNRLHAEKHQFVTDLEIQLLLKQGQVEVDPGNFIPDYTSSLLIHRRVVEDLNKQIRQLSDSKIASMVESKDFRKGIVQLEWEHKKMTMQMEDLLNKMRDIINMKVTREIQLYLTDPAEYDAKKAQEVASLEQTILIQREHHEKLVKEKKRTLNQMKKSIAQLMEKNDALMNEIERLNVSVNERRHIHEISGDSSADADRMLSYKEIVKRRRLVELAKAQSQEVAVLRAEVERLRMRTFATLVQIEH